MFLASSLLYALLATAATGSEHLRQLKSTKADKFSKHIGRSPLLRSSKAGKSVKSWSKVGKSVKSWSKAGKKTKGGADNTSGQGSEETPASVPCPCFDGSDLDTAVATIASDADIVFQSEQACVEGDFNGIRYSKYDHALGYGVALGNTNECEDADARMIISQEEAESCSLLLDAKCEEHAGALEAAAASAGVNEEPATCRCFDSNSLLSVVESVIDNSQILHSGSCDSNSANMYISYSIQAGDYPEAYAWGASTYNGELTCTHHDALQALKLQDEWDACKAIVDSACAQIADAQNAE